MKIIKENFDKHEYNSPYKTVQGNEGEKCYYPTRLDTYGKGCYFNCKYCYARHLLNFRGLWNPNNPSPAKIEDIYKIIKNELNTRDVVRLGGMVDCFQPIEAIKGVTYNTIRMLNAKKIHYLIVTKSDMITRKKYLKILDKDLAHIQISIPATENKILQLTDNAPPFERRKKAVEILHEKGFDVSVRLSPYLYEYTDYNKLNNIQCDKLLVEFLRINQFITKQMKTLINPTEFTHNEGGYKHLPLKRKLQLLKPLKYKEISICDDVDNHYNYFKGNYNSNPEDCCNLRM